LREVPSTDSAQIDELARCFTWKAKAEPTTARLSLLAQSDTLAVLSGSAAFMGERHSEWERECRNHAEMEARELDRDMAAPLGKRRLRMGSVCRARSSLGDMPGAS
jgi:hypothetical protein